MLQLVGTACAAAAAMETVAAAAANAVGLPVQQQPPRVFAGFLAASNSSIHRNRSKGPPWQQLRHQSHDRDIYLKGQSAPDHCEKTLLEKMHGTPHASSMCCALQRLWWAASGCLTLHGESILQSLQFERAENGQRCVALHAESKKDTENAVVLRLPLQILHLLLISPHYVWCIQCCPG